MAASFSSGNNNKRNIVLGTMLGLSLLLLAGLIYYYLNNNNAESDEAGSPKPAISANNGIDSSAAPLTDDLAASTEAESSTENEKPTVPDKRSSADNPTADSAAASVSDPNGTGPISFSVKGKSLTDLVAKIRAKSYQYMKNKAFTPVNPQFDETKNLFTCTLERIPSDYVRISIAHSDGTNPCDACDAVLNNNPGSSVLADKNKNGTIIKVIAVAAP